MKIEGNALAQPERHRFQSSMAIVADKMKRALLRAERLVFCRSGEAGWETQPIEVGSRDWRLALILSCLKGGSRKPYRPPLKVSQTFLRQD